MAPHISIALPLKGLVSLLFLAITITCTTSARILEAEMSSTDEIAPVVTNSVETPLSTVPAVAASTTPAAATGGAAIIHDHPLTFFMHDILGGTNPSARAITGIVTNPALNGQVPFAKPNGANFPLNNGVPSTSGNNALMDNNNLPFLTGLGRSTSNVIQNNNGGSGFFNGGQIQGAGADIRKLMFGTMTVIDDELTEGHELGSGLVGKAQGFYISSSGDGFSQTMAFTVMFENGGYTDSLCLFGVHRSSVSQSQIAVMGGTGKFLNAKGYATLKTLGDANPQNNNGNTDGLETILEITLYLAY
ncbi:Dirigent protein [Heracleum sosnowskyi]|uniref:Dirigent protein n=1 Tax=Heracleum sosnowskyi TaxID=360622 RepID=A0AAD8MIV9_9APIA|nr:Dirigent protein [Heracleum sosnowskyi]